MKFMLMMNAPRGTGDWDVDAWSPDDLKAHLGFMQKLNADLTAEGTFVGGEGLAPPEQARLVQLNHAGQPEVTDGPFAETKEFLAGYWLVQVATPEHAYEIAARISGAPGPKGKPLNLKIEVREVPSAPNLDA